MKGRLFAPTAEHVLGMLGLLFILVIGRLADAAYRPQRTLPRRARGFLARRIIDVITGIGWLADRLAGFDMRRPRVRTSRIARPRSV